LIQQTDVKEIYIPTSGFAVPTAGLAPQDQVIDSPPETLQSGDVVQLAAATPSSPSTQTGTPTSPAKAN
jgi:hypothetical protein